MEKLSASSTRPLTKDDQATLQRSFKGHKDAIAEMRALPRKSPELACAMAGDAADTAVVLLIDTAWKDFPVAQDAMRARMKAMRAELNGPASTPLEALLVDRVVACWLHLAHADTLYATNGNTASQRTMEHLEERRDRAHRRYLSAIKSLAQVRRMLVPMVQVNVAEQQVVANVGK